ncbi:MAG TPA: NADP-dependent oxidoreductase [Solirubrobacteraceae bacterium]|nr:NADP-dependent oxidoreductase [Solirubrobacteraceae bacterium]
MDNHAFRLASRPVGLPERSNWDYVEEQVGDPGDGEVVVRVLYLSLDPAMRGWISDRPSYIPPVGIGEVMRALGVGEVVASNDSKLSVGDHVSGVLGVQRYAVVPGAGLMKIDSGAAPLTTWLGALGMPGMTAYFGLLDIGRPEPGQTVVVSGAAGAVGHLVGQIARIKGARAVGIAGGPDKCGVVLEEYSFDATIDYKAENVDAALRRHCPDGIDVYFDNVGGAILDSALAQLARHARVVICGAISQYNETGEIAGPVNYLSLLVNHASMTGFVVTDYASQWPSAGADMGQWLAEGKLVTREHVVDRLETFPDRLLMLFSGENTAKLVLAVNGGA